jgi:hypothetical protein
MKFKEFSVNYRLHNTNWLIAIYFIVCYLLVGKIVDQVVGPTNEILSSTIVSDYQQNMTFTGVSRTLKM